jgi:hypothetical protein
MRIEFTEGTGTICSILNNPYWVKKYASPRSLKIWQLDLHMGKLDGKALSRVRGMVITFTGTGVFSEEQFSLQETLGGDGSSDYGGSGYTGFHNPISSGTLCVVAKGCWNYSVRCEGEFEFNLRGERKAFSALGDAHLDYVSVRGLYSEPIENLLSRFSAHYDPTRFEPPVEGRSIQYNDGETSRELIFRPNT